MRQCARFILAFGVLALPLAASAAAEDEVQMLRAQIEALSERLGQLEARLASPASAPATQPDTPALVEVPANINEAELVQNRLADMEWAARIKLKGDIRYRHELIDEDGKDSRTRQRVRARAGLVAKVADTVKVGMQIASGSDDPVSTNQTLGDGGSTKGVGLDLAYFDWAPTDTNLHILGGKFKNPLARPGGNGLMWDGDFNPEGLALAYSQGSFFATGVGLWTEERSSSSDSFFYGGQIGVATTLADGVKVKAGLGYTDFTEAQGREPFFDGQGRGNTLDASGNYRFGYQIVQGFAELSTELGSRPFSLFVDYANNRDTGEFDTGYALGTAWGKAKKPGTWQLGYVYQDLEADAVLALFADSDFAGGGTDGKGHVVKAKYAVTEKWNLALTQFITERGANAGSERDYNRTQLDLAFKY